MNIFNLTSNKRKKADEKLNSLKNLNRHLQYVCEWRDSEIFLS